MSTPKEREELAAQLFSLTKKQVRKYNSSVIDADDLVQETMLNLLDFFQPDSKEISTPVSLISSMMKQGLYVLYRQCGLGTTPGRESMLHRRISEVYRIMETYLGREPTVIEIADEMCMPPAICQQILGYDRFFHPVSLDSPSEQDKNDNCYYDFIADVSTILPDQHIEQKDLRRQVRRVLSTLEPLEEMTIKLRFGFIDDEEFSPQETAHKLEISLETEQITEVKAMRKLRHPSRSKYLEAFIH